MMPLSVKPSEMKSILDYPKPATETEYFVAPAGILPTIRPGLDSRSSNQNGASARHRIYLEKPCESGDFAY